MPPKKSALPRSRATKNNKRKRTTDQQIQNVENLDGAAECDITPAKRKVRGPAVIADSTYVIEDRPEIWRVGPHEFSCDKDPRKIAGVITRLALNYMPKPLRSYNAFPIKAKNNTERAFLGLGADFTESNGGRNFQALLNVQSENEVATSLGADDEWFGEERQNNQPF